MTGNFNTLLTSMDRSFRQKIDEAAEILNNTIDQVNLIDAYISFSCLMLWLGLPMLC